MIAERNKDTGKKTYSTRTKQGNKKRKESGESRKHSKDKDMFEVTFEI